MTHDDHLEPDVCPPPDPWADVMTPHLRRRAWRAVAKLAPTVQLQVVVACMHMRRAERSALATGDRR